jgi:hypothetical protein
MKNSVWTNASAGCLFARHVQEEDAGQSASGLIASESEVIKPEANGIKDSFDSSANGLAAIRTETNVMRTSMGVVFGKSNAMRTESNAISGRLEIMGFQANVIRSALNVIAFDMELVC